jgi:hypothetical protein
MARIRTIKPEFWQDEKLAPLDAVTRLVFLGLIGMADDAGRVLDNVKIIDAFIFPETSDSCREALATLSRMGRVLRGTTSSGQRVIQITHWADHQRVDRPNLHAALPEIVVPVEVDHAREDDANQSRESRERLAPRPTTNDLRSPTDEQRTASEHDATATRAEVRGWTQLEADIPADNRPDLVVALREARDPDSLRRTLVAVSEGMTTGVPFTAAIIGQALTELRSSGRAVTGLSLRTYCGRIAKERAAPIPKRSPEELYADA